MDVKREICQHCGFVSEVVFRRGDYLPSCPSCGNPLRAPKRVPTQAESGGVLQLRHVAGRGLGVFAARNIGSGVIVERCPVFVLGTHSPTVRSLSLFPYTGTRNHIKLGHILFPWLEDKHRALVLGYGMLYNHEPAGRSNIRYEPYIDPDTNRRFVDFYAKRFIEKGEELTQTYASNDRLWFEYKAGSDDA